MTALADLRGDYQIDPTHSRIGFVTRHAAISKVRGQFNEFSGEIVAAGENLAESSVKVNVTVASIDTNNEQRDGHLRTNDFFDPETYPEITFVSTAVQAKGDTLEVTGDLTIKGVTKSVTIPFEYGGEAVDPFGATRAGFEGSLVIDRRDYGITWNAPLETGGLLVGEKVTLEVEISVVKQG
ncbi:YceI family protein [Sediminivirga luteola]|jgi:polyisoprenoid-binding protein YceI|uniref:Polyisoprenoid-binding protein n=1 Tax=Sediminivirga luteola TaxID=1774748 RepID=A0A8J2TZ48_9MICO|nr:YceI family protein [Sediminivirga luteola]MCI2265552.1 YceI family protein [Sediminivirga luteola]GGA18822.1 polyisoprenoid-binding protein [Sediminivirga luteola]